MTIMADVLLVLIAAIFMTLSWQLLKYELCLHFCNRFIVKIVYKGEKVSDVDSVTYSINALNRQRAALKALEKLFTSDNMKIEHVQEVIVTQACC